MKIEIPEKVSYIISTLNQHGYEAYAVGGCVRDIILNRKPGDWDITTSARPFEVKSVFRRTVDTGIDHGTVTVMLDKDGFEVTTYRIDGQYLDNRHPESVQFTSSLLEDLKRRDFTMNAMAYHPRIGIVDAFHGMDDLKNKTIRCVGDPGARFDEDALRMLRAVRFSAQLGFTIDEATCDAIRMRVRNLLDISAERIQTELVKLLISSNPDYIHRAYELGITSVVMPEYDRIVGVRQNTPNHVYSVDKHTLIALKNIENQPILRLTMLLHDFGKPIVRHVREDGTDSFYKHPEVGASMARKILKRLKFDNYTLDRVTRLVKWHGLKYDPTPVCVRRALNRVGADLFDDFMKVQRADIFAKNPVLVPFKLDLLRKKSLIYHKVMEEGQCFEIKKLAVNGQDLKDFGIPQGRKIGAVLDRLVEWVIDDQSLNTKSQLLMIAGKIQDDPSIFEEKDYFFMDSKPISKSI